MIEFCRPGQILVEIAPNAAESNNDHAWQPSFAAEVAKWTPTFPAHPLGGLVSALPIPFLIHETVSFLMFLLFDHFRKRT